MKLYLAPEIVKRFPDYIMFTVVAKGINNDQDCDELRTALAGLLAQVKGGALANPTTHPRIASWRQAFRDFGADPDQYLPSTQNLLQMAADGREIPYYNPVVTLSNYISLKYLAPSGADDLDQVVGDFGIRLSRGDEIYAPIGGNEVEPVAPGQVVYADERKIMCHRWVWRQGEHTKVTRQTRNITMNIDILPPATREEGERAAQELVALLKKYVGGEVSYNVLDRSHTQEEVAMPPAEERFDNVYDLLEMRGYIRRTSDRENVRALLGQPPLTIYQGFDPTADSLHIGHLLSLMVFRYLQNAGHRMIFLHGAGTAQVGDPTGKTKSRRVMEAGDIERNRVAIQKQVQGIGMVDFENDAPGKPKASMPNNADWLNIPFFTYLREVALHFTVNKMIRMETFEQRLNAQEHLSLFEFLYPTLQGYDFLHLYKTQNCRLQMGGDDQWTNILSGVELVDRSLGQSVYAMTFGLLLDASGQKMGKTAEGEAIWLNSQRTTPFAFYQYWVNSTDSDLRKLFRLFTFLPLGEIEQIVGGDPRAAQHRLAYEVTKIVHGEEAAKQAQTDAQKAFGAGAGLPDNVPTVTLTSAQLAAGVSLVDVIVQAADVSSKSEARRLIQQGAVRVNDAKESALERRLGISDALTVGDQRAIVIRYRKSAILKVIVE
jgi:tyrosyl-tRNA synthetase